MSKCINCGDSGYLFVNAQARGTAIIWFTNDGQFLDTETDETWWKRSKTVRCGNCLKIRKDLVYNPISREVEEI